jgi:quercetin dioxygenase-like cupin family protein
MDLNIKPAVDARIYSKAAVLSDITEYQAGAVVSSTILKKETGNITIFAFGEGQGLSEHTAPFDAMVHILDGKADVIISGNSHILSAGEGIVMPANEPHALKALTNFKMMLIMIKS